MRKPFIKQKKSNSFRRKSKQKSHSCSVSAAEEASNSSLRLMMLQEESEFSLFRQQQSAAEKEQRAAKRERMIKLLYTNESEEDRERERRQQLPQRRSSEPDLLRCSTRIITNASTLSWGEYRRKRGQYIRSVFFCSEHNLCGRSEHLERTDGLTHGKDFRFQPPKAREKHSTSSLKLSLNAPSLVDYHRSFRNRLNKKIQHVDSSRSSSSGCSSSTISRQLTINSRSSNRARQHTHEECCECAYRPLSQTVTLMKVPDGAQSQWRACMVSGRDSLSCSLNSP